MSDFGNSTDIAWFVAHTYSGYENKVRDNILKIIENRADMKDKILEVRVPTVTRIEKQDGVEVEIEEKVYPSYVLVKMMMTDETWHVIRNIRGVTGFVGPGSRPVPLTDEEIAAIGIEEAKPELAFREGDSIRVKSGPLAGYLGVVDSISEDLRTVKVVTSIFNRETTVELPSTDIEPVIG
ncbi:MAG: transcription termination/antitermination factor NusG [Clostridiales bacterium]|jgi:transcriptional antiterminator NusG|nr:transcription termination/antitermination factor NusG [Clostridiales bacterium]